MPRILISYRRADSVSLTGRIRDRLVAAFGEDNVFKDVDDILPGADFRQVIRHEVESSDVLLVVIGNSWSTITDGSGQRRLLDPDDFVRIEVETGLRQPNLLVIPVLVQNATMPSPNDLPPSLRDLVFRNAAVVREDPDFNHDINKLTTQLRKHFAANIIPPLARPTSQKTSYASSHQSVWLIAVSVVGLVLGVVLLYSTLSNSPNATATYFRTVSQTASDEIITSSATPSGLSGKGVAATADTVMSFINVRSGPSPNDADIGDVLDQSQVLYYPDTRTNDGWVLVEQGDLTGWVNTAFVTFRDE